MSPHVERRRRVDAPFVTHTTLRLLQEWTFCIDRLLTLYIQSDTLFFGGEVYEGERKDHN